MQELWYIEIIAYANDGVYRQIGPYPSERMANKADRGVNINLDHERYYTRVSHAATPR